MSRPSQDNDFCGKNSQKSIKYSQSYDVVCQLALLRSKGLQVKSLMYVFIYMYLCISL